MQFPNRCQHIKINGTQCGCPALRRNKLCYFHKRHHDERVQLNLDRLKNDRLKSDQAKSAQQKRRCIIVDLPVLEDANSIQISLMQIMRLILTGELDSKTAGLLLYALQTASANLSRTTFEPKRHNVILNPADAGETLLGESVWQDDDFIDESEDDEEGDEEEDDGVDSARRAGILKAAEYLYELDRKNGGIHGFAPKPAPATAPAVKPDIQTNAQTNLQTNTQANAQTKLNASTRKPPAREFTAAEVRQQVREVIVKRTPALLAGGPDLIARLEKESDASP